VLQWYFAVIFMQKYAKIGIAYLIILIKLQDLASQVPIYTWRTFTA